MKALLSAGGRAFYENAARDETAFRSTVLDLRRVEKLEAGSFGKPMTPWLDAPYDAVAQARAYEAVSPLEGRSVLQLGGKGHHAVKFLLAGASRAYLVTPILEEARTADRLAAEFGLEDRFESIVGVGESIPLRDGSVGAVYSGACIQFTLTELSFSEIHRVLCAGGRFGAAEVWRAPFYSVGIRVFGTREREVPRIPLDKSRVKPFYEHFADARVTLHGGLFRYPLLAAARLGVRFERARLFRFAEVEESLLDRCGVFRRLGGSAALAGTKVVGGELLS